MANGVSCGLRELKEVALARSMGRGLPRRMGMGVGLAVGGGLHTVRTFTQSVYLTLAICLSCISSHGCFDLPFAPSFPIRNIVSAFHSCAHH